VLGPWRFLLFYFAVLGASGAIAGVLATHLMLRPCAKVTVFALRFFVRVRAYWGIGAWGLLQLVSLAGHPEDDVAYLAHVGRFAAGALLFVVLRPAVRVHRRGARRSSGRRSYERCGGSVAGL
jgi:membrane associated rhomboid family serine protease